MVTGLLVLILVTIAVTGFILDGYRETPWLSWGKDNDGPKKVRISLLTRWLLGPYVVLCTLLLIPEIREQLTEQQRVGLLVGLALVFFATGFLDAMTRRWSPYKRKHRSSLSWEEKHVHRKQRKQQRLRQAQAHRKR